MSKLRYDFKTIADLKAKWNAATELFGNDNVTVCLTGIWSDKKGESVFFDYMHSLPIDHISPVYVYVDVDGEMTGVNGRYGKAQFELIITEAQR
jgi:hypothetical protein